MIDLRCGDCLTLMKDIPDNSIDMILADPPYGTTRNKWDSVIPLDKMWAEYKRIIKPGKAICLFSQSPFDKILGCSNLEMLKYEWIWEKPSATGFLNSKFAPLKAHENILVFSTKAACYVKNKDNAMPYYPQMSEGKPYTAKQGTRSQNYDVNWLKSVTSYNSGTRYPRDVLRFNSDKERLHPTQKPVYLLEYFIKTYTNPDEIVLDNCMGSGSTGVACKNTSRSFIGIELNPDYFQIAKKRIEGNKEVHATND